MMLFSILLAIATPLTPQQEQLADYSQTMAKGLDGGTTGQENFCMADAAPTLMVDHLVCPISGSVSLSELDAQAVSLEPITIDRSYSSDWSPNCYSPQGWVGGHLGQVRVVKFHSLYQKGKEFYGACYCGAYRQKLFFYSAMRHKASLHDFVFNTHLFTMGLTNLCGSELSGRSYAKNCTLNTGSSPKNLELKTGSGLVIKLKPTDKSNLWKTFEQILPNSNRLLYAYDDKWNLTEAKTVTSSGKTLSWAKYDRQNHATHITLSNGASVVYEYNKDGDLIAARPSDSCPVTYDYNKYHRLLTKTLPHGRRIDFEYYPGNHKETSDNSPAHRVKTILTPSSPDGSLAVIRNFHYYFNSLKKAVYTAAFDPWGRKTRYESEEGYLCKIENFEPGNTTPYSTERLFWGAPFGHEGGCLTHRAFANRDGQVQFVKSFDYDDRGNPILERLYGNFSGNSNMGVYFISAEDLARDVQEHTWKRKEFSVDRNLLLAQEDGLKRIEKSYLPGTDLTEKNLVMADGMIKKRNFFFYDENRALVREVVDDGCTRDYDDLSGVTERRIDLKIYHNSLNALPDSEEERGLDLTTGEERLIQKKESRYDSRGRVVYQAVFDANGDFAYEKTWEYDRYGCCIREVDAIGGEVHRTYDELQNLQTETGPLFDHSTHYLYDLMNRCIRVEERHGNETLTRHTRYDVLGRITKEIDPYGHETDHFYDPYGRESKLLLPAVANEEGQLVQRSIEKSYDVLGFQKSITDTAGQTTQTDCTILGKPYRVLYPDGTEERWEYNLEGEVIKHTSVEGLVTIYRRDWQGRALETKVFSREGDLLSTRSATYSTHQLLSETDESGSTTYYSYDYAGRCVRTEREGVVSETIYDPLGRVSEKRLGGIQVQRFVYDLLGRVIKETTESLTGEILLCKETEYDLASRKISETVADSTTRYIYNSKGELIEMLCPEERSLRIMTDHAYINAYGQKVKKVTQIDPRGQLTETEYDALGKEKRSLPSAIRIISSCRRESSFIMIKENSQKPSRRSITTTRRSGNLSLAAAMTRWDASSNSLRLKAHQKKKRQALATTLTDKKNRSPNPMV